MTRSPSRSLTLATNNGDVGGGEVMLLLLADAARELGVEVRVVGPTEPGDLVERAAAAGHETVALDAAGRRPYMRALRRWDRDRRGLLWCNGLVPATATAGRPGRVVHLHQPPARLQHAARALAVRGAEAVVVPSQWMADRVPHTVVLPNWTLDLDYVGPRPRPAGATRVGFLGRLTLEKGVDVLGRALASLLADGADLSLVLAGEQRFGTARDEREVGAALAPLAHRIERLGWVPPAELFGRIDLAVFPSTWPEPFGLVAAEAMAAGVPFVVSDSGALPDVAGPDHPWVARHGSSSDLARVVEAALRAPQEEVAAHAKSQRARWEQEFSPLAGRERLGALLRRLGVR